MAAKLRVMLLGPREKRGAEVLERQGFSVVHVPVVRVAVLEEGLKILEKTLDMRPPDYLVFTSSVGVSIVFSRLRSKVYSLVEKGGLRIASIGPATTHELRVRGVEPDVEAFAHTGESLGREICLRRPRSAVLARSRQGLRGIVDILEGCGVGVADIPVYDIVPDHVAARRAVDMLLDGLVDYVVLTSPLIAGVFLDALKEASRKLGSLRERLIAIGPSTALKVEEILGWRIPYPGKHTLQGVAEFLGSLGS